MTPQRSRSAHDFGARAVLITGCSSGIGECIAHGLARRGFRVFATARRARDVARLKDLGLESMQLDLASSESITRACGEVLRCTGGHLYGLVNNGAYGQPGAVEDLSREALRHQFEINVFGTHELTTRLIPVFRTAGTGRIIQISSILGRVSLAYRGAYNASKYALESLSDTMRLELAATNIFVSLIEPGPIESRFRANALAAYREHIDAERSVHRDYYAAVERRLEAAENVRFTLPADAVLGKVAHALESPRPKTRYLVTFPAHLLARLKRTLPDRWLDGFLLRFAGR